MKHVDILARLKAVSFTLQMFTGLLLVFDLNSECLIAAPNTHESKLIYILAPEQLAKLGFVQKTLIPLTPSKSVP